MRKTQLKGTTPVPNALFDEHLPNLKSVQLKLLLVIIRQTSGWQKQRDWISANQLRQKTGCSKRALSDAIHELVNFNLIEVSGEQGKPLTTPEERKGKLRLYYRFKKPCVKSGETHKSRAKNSDVDQQELLTTKETATKKDFQKSQSLRFTEHDIQQFANDLNKAGSIDQLLLHKEAIKYKNDERVIMIQKDVEGYRDKHLADYSLPGLQSKLLKTPYTIWMTLYHRLENTKKD